MGAGASAQTVQAASKSLLGHAYAAADAEATFTGALDLDDAAVADAAHQWDPQTRYPTDYDPRTGTDWLTLDFEDLYNVSCLNGPSDHTGGCAATG